MQRHADATKVRTTGVTELDALDVGEETLLSVPNSDVEYHYFRRTEDGFEERVAGFEWRPVSLSEIREAFDCSASVCR